MATHTIATMAATAKGDLPFTQSIPAVGTKVQVQFTTGKYDGTVVAASAPRTATASGGGGEEGHACDGCGRLFKQQGACLEKHRKSCAGVGETGSARQRPAAPSFMVFFSKDETVEIELGQHRFVLLPDGGSAQQQGAAAAKKKKKKNPASSPKRRPAGSPPATPPAKRAAPARPPAKPRSRAAAAVPAAVAKALQSSSPAKKKPPVRRKLDMRAAAAGRPRRAAAAAAMVYTEPGLGGEEPGNAESQSDEEEAEEEVAEFAWSKSGSEWIGAKCIRHFPGGTIAATVDAWLPASGSDPALW